MQIWRVWRTDEVTFDEVQEVLVVAATEEEARRKAAAQHGDEPTGRWWDPATSSAVVIGEAASDLDAAFTMRTLY
jgi:hypothetical protein